MEIDTIPKPYRIMMMGAPLDQFFLLSAEEKAERFLPGFKRMLANWENMGAQVVASITDDLLGVGAPRSLDYVWFLRFDVQSLDTVAAVIKEVRSEGDSIRLDKYIPVGGTDRKAVLRPGRELGSATSPAVSG